MNFAARAVSIASITLLAFGALALVAPPANAETLHTGRAKTVKIRPAKIAPAGAKIVRSVITVKKGKKTVAKNRTSYKATKGTYKVTTTVSYRQPRTITPSATSVWSECRIATMRITSDRTDWRDWSDGTGYYAGQVTFSYTGTCADTFYDQNGTAHYVKWATTWQYDDYVITDNVTPSASRSSAIIDAATYGLGDVDFVDGTEMSTLPAYQAWTAPQALTRTRTVRVKR